MGNGLFALLEGMLVGVLYFLCKIALPVCLR